MKGWRTILWNLLSVVVTSSTMLMENFHILNLDTKEQVYVYVAIILINNVGNMLLRKYTNTPIGKSE